MGEDKYYNELNNYERIIEEKAEKFKRVENVEYWKKVVEKAAENTRRYTMRYKVNIKKSDEGYAVWVSGLPVSGKNFNTH